MAIERLPISDALTRAASTQRDPAVRESLERAATVARGAEANGSPSEAAFSRDELVALRGAMASVPTFVADPTTNARIASIRSYVNDGALSAAGRRLQVVGNSVRSTSQIPIADAFYKDARAEILPKREGQPIAQVYDKLVDTIRNRPIPMTVTDSSGRVVGESRTNWNDAQPTTARTAGILPVRADSYLLQPNAITDGSTEIRAQALDLRSQLTNALVAAGRGRPGMSSAEIVRTIGEVKITAWDGYAPEALSGARLQRALDHAAILRVPPGVEGRRWETDGRSAISPILAFQPAGRADAGKENVWGIRSIAISLQ